MEIAVSGQSCRSKVDRTDRDPGGARRPQAFQSSPARATCVGVLATARLYYLHRVDPKTPLEDSLATIDEFRRAGRIGLVGLSEVSVEQIDRAREVTPIAAVQNHFNLSERKHDQVVDYCAEEGILFVPYFPLKGEARPEVAEIAERYGATPAQVVLAWLIRRSPTMLPIPATLSLEHLRENLAALDLELTDAEFEALA
jgi:pyridoxine 4-dehydrogenase